MLFLHGILGRGGNLRGVARKVLQARPRWGAVLVDLRLHGSSRAFPQPHTVAAAAADLLELDAHLPGPVRGVLGHSFGGKVALESLRLRGASLAQVFTVDSSPSARPPDLSDSPTRDVIALLEALPPTLPSRAALVERAVAAGLGRGLGDWLAMNLERRGDVWALALDLAGVRALLEDYLALDQWPIVEALPSGTRLHAIIGERSRVYTDEDRARLAHLSAASSGLTVHYLPTGHWVHVEDPEGLVHAVVAGLEPDDAE